MTDVELRNAFARFRQAHQEQLDEVLFQLADLKRQKAMMIRPGAVKSFDAGTNTAVLDVGLDTHAVDLGSHVAHWGPLAAGQQVTLLCPDGELSNAVVIPGGYCDGFAKPSDRPDEQAFVPPGGGGDKAALRVRKGGLVRAEVKERTKLKLYFADEDKTYAIKLSALEETEKD